MKNWYKRAQTKVFDPQRLDYEKVESLLTDFFNRNAGKWEDSTDEIGLVVEWNGENEYKTIGPIFGTEKEVVLPQPTQGWIEVGFFHNHTDGETFDLSDFDISEAEAHVARTKVPICFAVAGVSPYEENYALNIEWFEENQ
jgi:hypothetical protein